MTENPLKTAEPVNVSAVAEEAIPTITDAELASAVMPKDQLTFSLKEEPQEELPTLTDADLEPATMTKSAILQADIKNLTKTWSIGDIPSLNPFDMAGKMINDDIHPYVKSKVYGNLAMQESGEIASKAMWNFSADSDDQILQASDDAYKIWESMNGSPFEKTVSMKEHPVKYTAGEVASLVPYAIGTQIEGLKYGVLTGGAMAGLGAMTGGGLLTSPELFAVGFKGGHSFGIVKKILNTEGGNIYKDMRRKGISKRTAQATAIPAGLAIGILELMQFKTLTNPLKRMAAVKMINSKVAKNALATALSGYLKDAGVQVAQEDLQTIVEASAKAVSGMVDKNLDIAPTTEDVIKELLATTQSIAVASLAGNIPGAIYTSVEQSNKNLELTEEIQRYLDIKNNKETIAKNLVVTENEAFNKTKEKILKVADALGVKIGTFEYVEEERFLKLSSKEGYDALISSGKTPEQIQEMIKNGEQIGVFGEHQLGMSKDGQTRSNIRIFQGFSSKEGVDGVYLGDIWHEFAHAVEEQGGIPAWHGTAEEHAQYIADIFDSGQENTLIELTTEGSRLLGKDTKQSYNINENFDTSAIPEVTITSDETANLYLPAYQFSTRTLSDTQKAFTAENNKVKMFTPEQVKTFFKDQNNVMAFILANKDLLDYVPNNAFSSLKDNSDPQYTKSVDFTTMCIKRYIMQSTVDEIQMKLGRPLKSNEYMMVREQLQKKGIDTSCGACYVDSRRINMGTVINKAINGYWKKPGHWQVIDNETGTLLFEGSKKDWAKSDEFKEQGDKPVTLKKITTREWIDPLKVPKEYLLSMSGMDKMSKDYPKEYAKFRELFAGTQMKIPESRTEYRGEILGLSESVVEQMNKASGLRWQSWSDFELPHLLDAMQVIGDMAVKGLKGQLYTKQPNVVEALAQTGIMINGSLIPKGNGFDANGRLVFDETQSFPFDKLMEYRKKYNNVGSVAIGVSDEHIKALLKDPRIDYVIPYHSSGLSAKFKGMMGMTTWEDYTKEQGFKAVDGGDTKQHIYWNEYNGDLAMFDSMLKERGLIPPFERMRNWEGYEKLLTDRRIRDNKGKIIIQEAVKPVFDEKVLERLLKEYKGTETKSDEEVVNGMVESLSGIQRSVRPTAKGGEIKIDGVTLGKALPKSGGGWDTYSATLNPNDARLYSEAQNGGYTGKPSMTKGAIDVIYTEEGQLLVEDGWHRIQDAINRGDKTIEAKISIEPSSKLSPTGAKGGEIHLYHGTSEGGKLGIENKGFIIDEGSSRSVGAGSGNKLFGEGVYFTDTEAGAKSYGDSIVKVTLPQDTNIKKLDGDEFIKILSDNKIPLSNKKKISKFFQSQGIDGLYNTDTKETVVFNLSKLSPKDVAKGGEIAPIVAYHKTDADFTEFDPSKFGKNDYGYAGQGVYLTPKALEGMTGGKNTIKTEIILKNPYVRTKENWKTDPLNPYVWIANKAESGTPLKEASKMWTDMMKDKGYDGFIDKALENGEIVVFDPKNVKILSKLSPKEGEKQMSVRQVQVKGRIDKLTEESREAFRQSELLWKERARLHKAGKTTAKLDKELSRLTTKYEKANAELNNIVLQTGMQLSKEKIQMKASEVVSNTIKNINKGIAFGKKVTKDEIDRVQTEAIAMLESSDLEAKDKAKFIRAIKNIQSQEDLEKAMPELQERASKLVEIATKKDLVARISDIVKDRDLRTEYIDKIDESIRSMFPPELIEGVSNVKELIKNIKTLSVDDLSNMLSTLENLENLSKLKDKLFAIKQRRSLISAVTETRKAIEDSVRELDKGISTMNEDKKKTRTILDNLNFGASDFFARARKIDHILRQWGLDDLVTAKRNAENKKDAKLDEYATKISKLLIDIGDAKTIEKMGKEEISVPNVKRKMTRMEMISVVLNSGRQQNLDRLMDNNLFTAEEIDAIKGAITPAEQRFVDGIFEIYNEIFDQVDKAQYEMLGTHIRKTEGQYFNLSYDYDLAKKTADDYLRNVINSNDAKKIENARRVVAELSRRATTKAEDSMFNRAIGDTLFFSDSFTKKITGSNAPLYLSDPIRVIGKHINDSLHYAYNAPVLLDAKRVLSNVESTIQRNVGDATNNQIKEWLDDNANPKHADNYVEAFSVARSYVIFKGLALNSVVSLYQLAGMGNTVIEIGVKDTASGVWVSTSHPLKTNTFIANNSDFMNSRDKNFDAELKRMLESSDVLKQEKNRNLINSLSIFVKTMDKITANASWIGAYNKYIDDHSATGEAFTDVHEKAVSYADGVVDRALGSARAGSLAGFFRDKNGWATLVTLFKTTANADWNYLADAVDNLKNSKSSLAKRSVDFGYVMGNFAVRAMMMSMVMGGGRFDPEKFLTTLISYPFQGIPLLGDILDGTIRGLTGKFGASKSAFILSLFEKLGKTIGKSIKNTNYDDMSTRVGMVARELLLPNAVNRFYEGARDLIQQETNDWRRLIWSKSALKEEY